MPTIRIQTAQNVTLEYEIASIGDRIAATLIDYLLYFAWFVLWAIIVGAAPHLLRNAAVVYWLVSLPTVFYFLACEVFLNGQTIGKKSRHLRVMRLDGTAPRLSDYLLRWLLRPVEIVYTGGSVALVTLLVSRYGQRLGDMAAGTIVVNLRARPQAVAPAFTARDDEDYELVFEQVTVLTDQDIALIRRLANQAVRSTNPALLHKVAERVKTVTGVRSDLADIPFLQTVLRDHAHYSAAQGV